MPAGRGFRSVKALPAWARWSALLVASTIATGLVNFAFGLVVAKLGGEDTWSAVSPLLAAGTAGGFAALGIEYAVTRETMAGEGIRRILHRIAPFVALLAATFVVSLACASSVARFLHLATATPVPLCVALFDVSVLLAVPSGILVGKKRIGTLALLTTASALLRVSLLWVVPGSLVTRAIVCSIISVSLGALAMFFVGIRQSARIAGRPEKTGLGFGSIAASGAFARAALWVTVIAPVVIARHFLPLHTAGELATVTFVSSSLAYTAAPVATAFFPLMMADKDRRHLRNGLLVSIGLVVFGMAIVVPVGPWLLRLLYHTVQPHLTMLLVLGCLGVVFQVASSFLVWGSLARNDSARAVYVAAFAALPLIGLLLLFHSSPAAILAAAIPSMAAVGLISQVRWERKDRRALAERGGSGRRDLGAIDLAEVSAGVMAHNEELTIARCLRSLLDARGPDGSRLDEVIVIVSGTDLTEELARRAACEDRRIRVMRQVGNPGKSAAVNMFLEAATRNVLVLSSADVVLGDGMLAELVAPLADAHVGMCGGSVLPMNARRGLCNRLVHLVWALHAEVCAVKPKLGEVVAFRRCFDRIDDGSLVDEVSIEECVATAGLELRYVPAVRVYNHGPTCFGDFLRHRYRIHRGHLAVAGSSGYKTATLSLSALARGTTRFLVRRPLAVPLLALAALLEIGTRSAARVVYVVAGAPSTGKFERIDSAKVALPVLPGKDAA